MGMAINSPFEGATLWNVNLDGGLFGINVYAEESDDAIDLVFDWVAENEPNMLNDGDLKAYVEEYKITHNMDDNAIDTLWEELDENFYSGGSISTHYVFRDNFSICEVNE